MAQQKKKQSGFQLQAIAHAHHKNEFMLKLKYIMNYCCGGNIYSLIPQIFLEKIYAMRCQSLMVVAAEGHSIPVEVLNYMKRYLSASAKYETIVLPQGNLKITLDDYFTVCQTIFSLFHWIKNDDFPNAEKVRSSARGLVIDNDTTKIVNDKFSGILDALGFWDSKIGSCLYWLKYELKVVTGGKPGLHNIIQVFTHNPDSIQLKINGKVRPASRLSWAYASTGIEYTTIRPSVLKLKSSIANRPMKVYVQSHALIRLRERIDCVTTSILHLNMYESFKNPKVSYDNNKNLLIEYRIFGTKAGYFRIDVVKGIVAIRTFLFLTNNGTHESHLLWKNTGLQKLDKKYLALDRLSNFMSSDIGNNDQIRKIFKDADCQSLLELYEKINKVCTKRPSQSTSNLMLEYLGRKSKDAKEVVLA